MAEPKGPLPPVWHPLPSASRGSGPGGGSGDGGWQPPRPGRGVTTALAAMAIGGAMLVLAAWRLP